MGRTGSMDFGAFEKLYHSVVNVITVSVIAILGRCIVIVRVDW